MTFGKPIWIRQVLIPGITDNEEDLVKLKEFISSLKTVEKVELLPYHDLGKFKWENLKLRYPLEDVPPATLEDVEMAKKILRNLIVTTLNQGIQFTEAVKAMLVTASVCNLC